MTFLYGDNNINLNFFNSVFSVKMYFMNKPIFSQNSFDCLFDIFVP